MSDFGGVSHGHVRIFTVILSRAYNSSDIAWPRSRDPQSLLSFPRRLTHHADTTTPFMLLISIHLTNRNTIYIEDGYSITLTEAPNERGGRLWANLALTTPLLPCGRVTLPQMTLILVPCRSRAAR